MIIDSHCHAWTTWPYQPPVPDATSRGRVEQLLHEMDLNEVGKAVIVCAQIEHNPENNRYIADQVRSNPERLGMFADLDSVWSPSYRKAGAVDRLSKMIDEFPLCGFTHYLDHKDDGSWLVSDEGVRLFQYASEKSLIASLSCQPHQQEAVRKIAQMFPAVPILCHHMGLVGDKLEEENNQSLKQLLLSASYENIYFKVSGFAYAAEKKWDYPYSGTFWILRALYEKLGPERLCWGSDYPVVRFFMTYRQSIEVLRTHCEFISPEDLEWILGKSMQVILNR